MKMNLHPALNGKRASLRMTSLCLLKKTQINQVSRMITWNSRMSWTRRLLSAKERVVLTRSEMRNRCFKNPAIIKILIDLETSVVWDGSALKLAKVVNVTRTILVVNPWKLSARTNGDSLNSIFQKHELTLTFARCTRKGRPWIRFVCNIKLWKKEHFTFSVNWNIQLLIIFREIVFLRTLFNDTNIKRICPLHSMWHVDTCVHCAPFCRWCSSSRNV